LGISFLLDFIIFLTTLFLLKKKHFHAVQYLFVFLIAVFLYSSFISSIVDNLELWKIKAKPVPFVAFRLSEIILFPILTVWFIELVFVFKNRLYRTCVLIFFIASSVIIERWLLYLDIIEFNKWYMYQTIITWFFLYLISFFIHKGIGKLLVKEGTKGDSSLT
jgi:hypothetical protein